MEPRKRDDRTEKLLRKLEMYRQWSESAHGQEILADLTEVCHVNRTTIVQAGGTGAGDPLLTVYNEGKRAVWMYIQAQIRVAKSPEMIEMILAQPPEEED